MKIIWTSPYSGEIEEAFVYVDERSPTLARVPNPQGGEVVDITRYRVMYGARPERPYDDLPGLPPDVVMIWWSKGDFGCRAGYTVAPDFDPSAVKFHRGRDRGCT